ncbi:MAG: YibE/F family protein [Candidatus Andersenbacteria bacterium]
MKRFLWIALIGVTLPVFAYAQIDEELTVPEEQVELPAPGQLLVEEFYRGEITEVVTERQEEFGLNGTQPYFQEVKVRLMTGPRAGEEAVIEYGALRENQKLKVGEQVILVQPAPLPGTEAKLYVFEKYRLNLVFILLALFVGLAVIFARWRGVTSLVGLGVSISVLTFYVVPNIVSGENPLVVSLLGSFVIAVVSIYLAHGFSRRTSVAVVSTLITIGIAIVLAMGAVAFLDLSGAGSEEAYFLQTSPIENLNLKGLLLGAIIIGALGVLDDITTAQAAAVDEIRKANPKLSRSELFIRGMSVGREHITSLINTLALAYVGTSLPALLLFTVYQRPIWVVANSEGIVEEVVRTLVGSSALMAAVPITTLLAAYLLSGRGGASQTSSSGVPGHTH